MTRLGVTYITQVHLKEQLLLLDCLRIFLRLLEHFHSVLDDFEALVDRKW